MHRSFHHLFVLSAFFGCFGNAYTMKTKFFPDQDIFGPQHTSTTSGKSGWSQGLFLGFTSSAVSFLQDPNQSAASSFSSIGSPTAPSAPSAAPPSKRLPRSLSPFGKERMAQLLKELAEQREKALLPRSYIPLSVAKTLTEKK